MAKKNYDCGMMPEPYTPPDPTSEFRAGASLAEGISGCKGICSESTAEEASRGRVVKPRSENRDEGAPEGGLW